MVNRIDAAKNLNNRAPLHDTSRRGKDWETLPALSESLESTAALTSPLVKRRPFWIQLFCNLPIGRKQVLALIVCELIPIVGMGVWSTLVLTNSLRTQLLEQAKSEVAVTETNYNIKLNQMGYGSRGQADNTTIVSAVRTQSQGSKVNGDLATQVRQILRNEVKARQMEYATLVDKDLRIVVNANADRQGETFNPNGLVSKVLKAPTQLKASEIVSESELTKEAPPLPDGFNKQDTLIRYVVTPIRDPDTKAVIGALVFGDIVNAKLPIVSETLKAFDGGYSAVYERSPSGKFLLATALSKNKPDTSNNTTNLDLPATSLLDEAAAAKGNTITQRLSIGGHSYMVAAKAVPNQVAETPDGPVASYGDKATAILIRGTPEDELNALIASSLQQEALVLGLTLLVVALWTAVFRRLVLKPLEKLEQTTQAFAEGDRTQRAPVYSLDEVGQLTLSFNAMADSIVRSEAALEDEAQQRELQAQQSELLSKVVVKIRQTLNLEDIMQTGVDEIREFLGVDRVLLYRFSEDYKSGVITAESVGSGWIRALGQTIHDPLVEGSIERYKNGRVWSTADVAKANLSHCHCEILDRFQVKANVVAPIKINGELVGLICAHQCSHPREWQLSDLDFFVQLSTQINYALDQADLLKQQEIAAKQARQLNEITSRMRETLDPQQIYKATLKGARDALGADRTIVYLFDKDWRGTIVAESVAPGFPIALGAQIADPCFAQNYIEKYRQGRVQATANIHEAGLTECYLEQLEPFQVKANLVVPILVEETLLGLLIAHQCSAPRQWQEGEINFFQQVATQLGFALEQAQLFTQREQARFAAEALSQEQQQQTQGLQMQLLQLLGDIEGAARGDLTVRAEVTAGEIGTVADFFNSIVESLRQIVTQVKESALEVNASLGQNEQAMQQLAEEASKQAIDTTRTLDSVEQMATSIQAVATSARQAAAVTRSAATTAEAGEDAMDLTVQNILGLRDTIGETAKKVKRLGESSQQISRVVSLINQIALQTNLLAINAGIEAARAGEQGQGFAVVAEEVGELAARSAVATQEIEQIVSTIQRETSEVVEAMSLGTTQVVEGTRLVGDAKQSLGQLLEVSRQIDTLVQSIFNATVSQTQTSEAIATLMRDVVQVSERTSDSSRQVSNSLRQTVEVAQELQASVGAFKVG